MTATQTTATTVGRVDDRAAAYRTKRLILMSQALREATASVKAGAPFGESYAEFDGPDYVCVSAFPDAVYVRETSGSFHRTVEVALSATIDEVEEALESATVS